jgi:hypothetical protein
MEENIGVTRIKEIAMSPLSEVKGGVEAAWIRAFEQELEDFTVPFLQHGNVRKQKFTYSGEAAFVRAECVTSQKNQNLYLVFSVTTEIFDIGNLNKEAMLQSALLDVMHKIGRELKDSPLVKELSNRASASLFRNSISYSVNVSTMSVYAILNFDGIIANNIYPESLSESLVLDEAKGGVVTAWQQYLEGVFQKAEFPVEDSMDDGFNSYSFKGIMKFVASRISADNKKIVLIFDWKNPPQVKTDSYSTVYVATKMAAKGSIALERFIDKNPQFSYGRVMFNEGRGDEWVFALPENGKGGYDVAIEVRVNYWIEKNIYPPTVSESVAPEESHPLHEAQGGVLEAWKTRLHQIYTKHADIAHLDLDLKQTFPFDIAVKFTGDVRYEGRCEVFRESGLAGVVVYLPVTFTSTLKYDGDNGYRPLNYSDVDEIDEWSELLYKEFNQRFFFRRHILPKSIERELFKEEKITFDPEHYVNFSKDYQEIVFKVYYELSDQVRDNTYPAILSEEYSPSLMEAKGGVMVAWEQYFEEEMEKVRIPLKFTYRFFPYTEIEGELRAGEGRAVQMTYTNGEPTVTFRFNFYGSLKDRYGNEITQSSSPTLFSTVLAEAVKRKNVAEDMNRLPIFQLIKEKCHYSEIFFLWRGPEGYYSHSLNLYPLLKDNEYPK